MRSLISYVVLALLVGLMSGGAVATIVSSDMVGAEIPGTYWRYPKGMGSETASPLIRAQMVRSGTFALAPSEAVYFLRNEDEQGQRLTSSCEYVVSGVDVDAEWWSVALYDENFQLITSETNRSSFHKFDVPRIGGGSDGWEFFVAPKVNGRTGILPSGNAGSIELAFRIYKPSNSLRSTFNEAIFPKVRLKSC